MERSDLNFLALWTYLKITAACCLLGAVTILSSYSFKEKKQPEETVFVCGNAAFTSVAAVGDSLAGLAMEGKALFTENCAICHAIDKVVVGPALKNLKKRRPMKWIVRFVHHPMKMIKSGDPYAVALYNEYNQAEMMAFPTLTEKEIQAIVEYVSSSP